MNNNEEGKSFICPQPGRWNSIYENLVKVYRERNCIDLGKTVLEIQTAGGPPTPLILSGWFDSTDYQKHQRWLDTIRWARNHDLEHLLIVDEADKCYNAGFGEFEPNYLNKFAETIMKRYELDQFVTKAEYKINPAEIIKRVPDSPGVYFVIHEYQWLEDCFVQEGTGGWYKRKNPNVSMEELRLNWVENADILYIGKAGGTSSTGRKYKATLRKRINELLRFGNYKAAPHWGGRYLWQHKENDEFKIFWYDTTQSGQNPVDLERKLIEEFKGPYNGKPPFANL